MESYETVAKILRSDKDVVKRAVETLTRVSGHDDVLARIMEGNDKDIEDRLRLLYVGGHQAEVIYQALVEKVKQDDKTLFDHFGKPTCDTEEGCKTLLDAAVDLAGAERGFFLKENKAHEFLVREPPQKTLSFFKLSSVEELLKKFDLFEIYSALRFMEDRQWLNTIFFKQLDAVTPDDFEERDIAVHVLHDEWLRAAESFLKKKYHNVSHLKELGIIFVIPLKITTPGETMRLFTLLLHYLHEVAFYSTLFQKYAREHAADFAGLVQSALRGDVRDTRFEGEDAGKKWLIVQRYLAKDDEYDWRLFEPHVNPEAIHWSKAEDDISHLEEKLPGLGLEFWHHLDHVGNYFRDASGAEVLVSFNLVDTVMSLVQEKDMIKYLYHHQEALWNKIFSEFFGRERMEELIMQNFNKGYIDLEKI